MSARHKLNIATANGILVAAGIAGGVFQSWLVFVTVAAVLAGGAIYAGDIRPQSRRR